MNSATPSPAAGQPSTWQELNIAAKGKIENKDFAGARSDLEASLAQHKSATAFRYMGVIARLGRDFDAAAKWFEQSLQADPRDHNTLCQVAELHFDCGNLAQATACYAEAIVIEGGKSVFYLERFIALGERVNFSTRNPVMEEALALCLAASNVNSYPVQALWFNTFLLNPAYSKIYSGGGFMKNLFGGGALKDGADLSPLMSPFFLQGMRVLTVFSLPFEAFVAKLRHALLHNRATPQKLGLTGDQLTQLAGTVSHYVYNAEYVLETSTEEQAELDKTPTDQAAGVALHACYAPLHLLKNAKDIEAAHRGGPIADVIATQLTDHFSLQERRLKIPAITSIDDEVSKLVREQYEESPYPRWRLLPKGLHVEKPARGLQRKGAQILVAGCGTGHEALQYAVLFPEAEVLAVDLSLTSMAYATGKAEELGIKNISFRQADILRLAELGRKFDCVVSGGVLHHIKDMFGAWKVLTGLLADDGVMKIALYSRTARRNLLMAHEIIKKSHPGLDLAGMRAFRHNSEKYLGRNIVGALQGFEDYYHLSMYRDMMFHVQERNLDLPEIADMLDKMGLQFTEFSLPRPVLAQFAAEYPGEAAGASLANWTAFEKKYPDTFSACYIFWCLKKKG